MGLSCDGKSQVKAIVAELSGEGAYASHAQKKWGILTLELEAPQLFVFGSAISPRSYNEDVEEKTLENITEVDVRAGGVLAMEREN